MSNTKSKLIDPEGGFIPAKKGITLSVLGPAVWAFTLVFYQMGQAIYHKLDYTTFCLFVSFGLSTLSGIYVSRSLYRNADFGGKALLSALTIILIYTSANGIQAGHSALATPDKEKLSAGVEIQQASILGFLDPRPWLQDAFSKAAIQELKNENVQLRNTVAVQPKSNATGSLKSQDEELTRQVGVLRNRINDFNKLQLQWMTLETNSDFRPTASKIKVWTDGRFGKDFYSRFFETPIKTD